MEFEHHRKTQAAVARTPSHQSSLFVGQQPMRLKLFLVAMPFHHLLPQKLSCEVASNGTFVSYVVTGPTSCWC